MARLPCPARRAATGAALALALAACGGGPSYPAPKITAFTIERILISTGGTTTLHAAFTGGTGRVTSADDPVGWPITAAAGLDVSPARSLTYLLTVTNPAGATATETVSVEVTPLPIITGFTANDLVQPPGLTDTLRVTSIEHAISTILTSDPLDVPGTNGPFTADDVTNGKVVGPIVTDTTFRLTAINKAGDVSSAEVTVTMAP